MNCKCQCNGKCKLLGGLEQKIMNTLWEKNTPLKPAEVQRGIADKYAYTTIMTVLKRMSDKGILSRRLAGNTYVYSPKSDRASFALTALDDLFRRLFCSYGEFTVPAFKKSASAAGFKL